MASPTGKTHHQMGVRHRFLRDLHLMDGHCQPA
jgi:hypothetical protein